MVWAISQDTSDGKFSKQLQEATGYKSKGVSTFNKTTSLGGCVFIETSESEANTDVSGDQCKWTNCLKRGKGCAENWSAVANQSSERLTDLMTDDTGCDDDEKRTFCCPDGVKHPTCKRHFYNVGHCIPGCGPTSGFEVASSKRSCSSGYAQTACCKGDTKGLDVYRQYKWYESETDCARDGGDKPCGWDVHFDSLLEKGKLSSHSLDAMALDLTKRESLHKMSAGMAMVLIVQQVMQAQKNSRGTREYRELLDKGLSKKWKHLVSATFAGTLLLLQDPVSALEVVWIWVWVLMKRRNGKKERPRPIQVK